MRSIARGELWMVNLNPTVGGEQSGTRPALVVSVDALNESRAGLVIVLPVTSRDKRIRSHVPIPEGEAGLKLPSFIKCEDIRSISVHRLVKRLGVVAPQTLDAVSSRLQILLGL